METAAEVTKEYAQRIIKAAQEHEDYLVIELLKEYGAKAYRQGREHLVETMRKLV